MNKDKIIKTIEAIEKEQDKDGCAHGFERKNRIYGHDWERLNKELKR